MSTKSQAPRHHCLFWGSSYDRGLDILLTMWPEIRAKVPDAELHICYGWDLFDKATVTNTERQAWKKDVDLAMQQDGVVHWGRLGKQELQALRVSCGIWAYPTYFPEINCITALETQADGLVPVVSQFAALPEVVKHGVLIPGDIYEPDVQAKFVEHILMLMTDKKVWEHLSAKCQKFARKYDWTGIANKWLDVFTRDIPQTVKLTIYTPTIREGFWNLMAANLAAQTYKNFEWIIVDDHPADRSAVAADMAKGYHLDIRYLRNKKHKKRTYSLVSANNTALQAATGNLFVFLQDFIVLTPTSFQQLVTQYQRHPNDLIAPVDAYFSPKVTPNVTNKIDWFDGTIDVVGKFLRQNIRIQNKGLRVSTHPFDFEQNYGAVPTSVARSLGGWYEFFDESLGFDNTEFAYRCLKAGHLIWIDELNVAVCIDHWSTVGKVEGGVNRTRRLNDPRFLFLMDQLESGALPLVRTQTIDDTIDLQYTIPAEVADEQCVAWIREHGPSIAAGWIDERTHQKGTL